MENYTIVRPEHLNHYGFLFGGYLLKWVDEVAYIAANIDLPGHHFVTVAFDNVEFKHSVTQGQIIRFSINRVKIGITSVQYLVEVFAENARPQTPLFTTNITFVNVDRHGHKQPIQKPSTGNRL
jgi:acyl-CoA hydrolase